MIKIKPHYYDLLLKVLVSMCIFVMLYWLLTSYLIPLPVMLTLFHEMSFGYIVILIGLTLLHFIVTALIFKFIRSIAAIRRVEYQAYLSVISSWEREYLLLNV